MFQLLRYNCPYLWCVSAAQLVLSYDGHFVNGHPVIVLPYYPDLGPAIHPEGKMPTVDRNPVEIEMQSHDDVLKFRLFVSLRLEMDVTVPTNTV